MTLESVARHAWTAPTPGARALRAALVPASLAYRAAVAARNRLYDAGWLEARRVPARVVSVGNLAVGGTGKTPAVLWLAERLAARGRRVAIVARGYRKRRPGAVVVGIDGRALVAPEEGGDEAVMMAGRFAGPVVTAERRVDAAALACARFGVDTIVLDDGFQHRALARDADLVLLAPGDVAAWCLPAGALREPPVALRRARAALIVGERLRGDPGIPLFSGRVVATAVVGTGASSPPASLAGRDVLAVAGIARPERFAATLAATGAVVRDVLGFPDHHGYTAPDAARIRAAAGGLAIVTTEKDRVKLARLPGLEDVTALAVALEVDDGEALVDLLER